MKKLALAVALAASFGSAQASSLYIDNLGNAANDVPVSFTNYSLSPTYTEGYWGALGFNKAAKDLKGNVRFTLLGSESGYMDNFVFGAFDAVLHDTDGIGSYIDAYLGGSGLLPFFFQDTGNTGALNIQFANGTQQTNVLGFVIMKGYGAYQYLIGFNDHAAVDADYDDIVIGVSAVPVPAALPLMASGLGLLGFAGFRRKSSAA